MSTAIGIDFGTTKTLVTHVSPDTDRPVAIRLGRGRDDIPTTAFFCEDGTLLFGDDADDNAQFDFSSYARGFKLALGSGTPLLIGAGKTFLAKHLTAAFLRHVKERCEREALMEEIVSAVITVPAIFSPAQRADLLEAAAEAGFKQVELLPEPVAAGMAFCKLFPQDAFEGSILVVDWGGGTLDLAMVSRDSDGRFQTLYGLVDGDEGIGGEALDEEMWKLVGRALAADNGVDLDSEPVERRGVHLAAIRQGKEMLSTRNEHRTTVLTTKGPKGAVVARKEFNAAVMKYVERGFNKASAVIANAREKGLDPLYALLVGGTCKVPLIQESLQIATGLECRSWQYSQEAVAFGAAIALSSAHAITAAASPLHTPTQTASPPPLPSPPPASSPVPPTVGLLNTDTVRSIVGGFRDQQFYVSPDIPADKAQRAIGSYAPHLKPADILLLCDITIFSTCTEGFLLTATSVHWRNPWDQAECMAFGDIYNVGEAPTTSMFTSAKVNVNEKAIDISLGDSRKQNRIMARLAKILREVAFSRTTTAANPVTPRQPAYQSNNSIHGQCPTCGRSYVAAASNRGASAFCVRCGDDIVIGE